MEFLLAQGVRDLKSAHVHSIDLLKQTNELLVEKIYRLIEQCEQIETHLLEAAKSLTNSAENVEKVAEIIRKSQSSFQEMVASQKAQIEVMEQSFLKMKRASNMTNLLVILTAVAIIAVQVLLR